MKTTWRRRAALLGGCIAVALSLVALHRWSDVLPGPAGAVYRSSVARDLSVYAYVYTDVGDPVEFLDARYGRYGGVARSEGNGASGRASLIDAAALGARERAPEIRTVRVFFIGNSYTFVNDLPRTLQAMALAADEPVALEIGTAVFGGGTLERHGQDTSVLRRICEADWDYVVLQEQSLRPIEDPDAMMDGGRRLAAEVTAAGATPLLYLTWARKQRPSTQDALDRAYLKLARETGARVVPVGPAWQAFLRLDPEAGLYMDDGSHPSPLGSFLAAATFYRVLFDRPPPEAFAFGFRTIHRPGTLAPERTVAVVFSAGTRRAVADAVEAAVSAVEAARSGAAVETDADEGSARPPGRVRPAVPGPAPDSAGCP